MSFYKVTILKEFIEEANNIEQAIDGAVIDLEYHLDRQIHDDVSIPRYLNIKARELNKEEKKELEKVMNK